MKLGITSTLNHVLQSIPVSRLEKERKKDFGPKKKTKLSIKGVPKYQSTG